LVKKRLKKDGSGGKVNTSPGESLRCYGRRPASLDKKTGERKGTAIMANNPWFLAKRPGAKRILLHAINHAGLGHLNRAIRVAQLLSGALPGVEVLFLIEGGKEFIEPTGFPWILVSGQAAESEPCEHITRSVLRVFQPTLAIYDTVLRDYIYRPIEEAGVKQVLIGRVGGLLRDQFRQHLPAINGMDLLALPHLRDEVAPADQALVARYSGRTVYSGPLVREKTLVSAESLRQRLGLARADKVVLLTFGGGGYDLAKELLSTLLAARAQILLRYPETKLIVISGPHFKGELPKADEFVCYASSFEPFFTDYLHIASVVVCMAGYNTVNEVAASGLPTICVPAVESDDQAGSGGMGEYARSFPNITTIGSTRMLVGELLGALAKTRDLIVAQEFRRRAESAARCVVDEIKSLLE
jgi:hypothetical protein